jgi:O-antigen/teichoic acid export membrane protein
MLLLPAVVKLKKQGKPTLPILLKFVAYITGIAIVIISICILFPYKIMNILFGEAYLTIAPLLWKYAIATSIFAISNIFAYYYLSIDKFLPVIFSGFFGILQIILIVLFHNTLEQVVHVQIIAMILLLLVQLSFFFLKDGRSLQRNTVV